MVWVDVEQEIMWELKHKIYFDTLLTIHVLPTSLAAQFKHHIVQSTD